MQRSVYLQGELGNKFGNKFIVNTNNYAEIFKCISANRPEFLPYIRKCHEQDIGFILETSGVQIDEETLLFPIKEGDVTISIVPAGSKKGIGKILAAVAIIFIMTLIPAGAAGGNLLTAGGLEGGALIAQKVGYALATNLALSGIQQIMAPDPAVDQDAPTNYLFSGGTGTVVEGDPVPLLYGELRVPGRPIAVDTRQGYSTTNNTRYGSGGGTYNSDGGKTVHK
jgi:predicted phage tail protein